MNRLELKYAILKNIFFAIFSYFAVCNLETSHSMVTPRVWHSGPRRLTEQCSHESAEGKGRKQNTARLSLCLSRIMEVSMSSRWREERRELNILQDSHFVFAVSVWTWWWIPSPWINQFLVTFSQWSGKWLEQKQLKLGVFSACPTLLSPCLGKACSRRDLLSQSDWRNGEIEGRGQAAAVIAGYLCGLYLKLQWY